MPKAKQMAGTLSNEAFEGALRRLHLAGDKKSKGVGREAARAVLVDGMAVATAAKGLGLKRQKVHYLCGVILQAALPPGWESEIISLPAEQMAVVRQMMIDARKELDA